MSTPAAARVADLSERLRRLETGGRPHWPRSLPLGVPGLEALLPEGRLPAGVLVELLAAEPGCGVWTLALALARAACTEGRGLLLVDPEGSFYPPAAWAWGIDLKRTVLVRPGSASAALTALAQALRCSALGLAVGWFDRIGSTDFRRLQLAAEASGTVGLLLRPAAARSAPSFAAVRLALAPLPSPGLGRRRVALEALHPWRERAGVGLVLEIDDETHHLCALARVAPAAAAARPSATG
ncbi:MAG TPA: hypothetical protein PKC45_08075 [Gemmatales bacterium]|nr:hypothetical protein [Gemmatales bacterium]